MSRTLILLSTFLSAFLLFLIQPLYAKYLLPFFGGTSSVWTISIFFYSTTLLLGYIYASLIIKWPSKIGFLVHTILLILAAGLLSFRWWSADSSLLIDTVSNQSPAFSVFLTLVHAVGLPVLLLASTSIIVQYLYARLTNKEPYTLFALSNTGSLIGLAAYPFLIEPFTNLQNQSVWWSLGFIVFLITITTAWKRVDKSSSVEADNSIYEHRSVLEHKLPIIIMAAVPTFLLASTTEFLSKGIASFPLLWVIPLMLYLMSFIVSFNDKSLFKLKIPLGFLNLLIIIPALLFMPIMGTNVALYWIGFLSVCLSLFFICTYFHRTIYEIRPNVNDLGPFYILVTFGGAVGSGLVGFVLPMILNAQIEVFISFGGLMIYFAFRYLDWFRNLADIRFMSELKFIAVVFPLLFIVQMSYDSDVLEHQRNFYGTLKVYESEADIDGKPVSIRTIVNGNIVHGVQAVGGEYEFSPVSYYGQGSGIDLAIESFYEKNKKPRLSVVGLGSGVASTYCNKVSDISYIEINPTVVTLARKYFSYLDYCQENTTIRVGDGRLVLETDLGKDIKYDIIMIDAFTDDAIPVHLLTADAFKEVYKPLLSDEGIVAFHISNKYLNLFPPIASMARNNGFDVVKVINNDLSGDSLFQASVWMLAVNPDDIESLLSFPTASIYQDEEILWTDSKNSIIDVLVLGRKWW